MTIIMVTHDLLAVSSNAKTLACFNELVYHGGTTLNGIKSIWSSDELHCAWISVWKKC